MGLFSSAPSPASTASDGSYKPMKREERRKCWEARDAYFTCLDRSPTKILDPIKDAAAAKEKCAAQDTAFDRDCASSWVVYFKQKRVADWEREQKILKLQREGAVPMDEANGGKKWFSK